MKRTIVRCILYFSLSIFFVSIYYNEYFKGQDFEKRKKFTQEYKIDIDNHFKAKRSIVFDNEQEELKSDMLFKLKTNELSYWFDNNLISNKEYMDRLKFEADSKIKDEIERINIMNAKLKSIGSGPLYVTPDKLSLLIDISTIIPVISLLTIVVTGVYLKYTK